MSSNRFPVLVGALVIALFTVFALSLPFMPSQRERFEKGDYAPIMPSSNPQMIEDQIRSRDIADIARNLPSDYRHLQKLMEDIPPFQPRDTEHLTQEDVDKYITAVFSYIEEMNHFQKNVMGGTPGVFRALGMVGMIQDFHHVVYKRSLVRANITEEEFNWIKHRILMAALFAVREKMKEDVPPEIAQRLEETHEGLLYGTKIKVHEETGNVVYEERLRELKMVPQHNISLFMDNYKNIRFSGVDFKRPPAIDLDKQAVMAAAANNPP